MDASRVATFPDYLSERFELEEATAQALSAKLAAVGIADPRDIRTLSEARVQEVTAVVGEQVALRKIAREVQETHRTVPRSAPLPWAESQPALLP